MQFLVPRCLTSFPTLYQLPCFTFTLFPVFLIQPNTACNLIFTLWLFDSCLCLPQGCELVGPGPLSVLFLVILAFHMVPGLE